MVRRISLILLLNCFARLVYPGTHFTPINETEVAYIIQDSLYLRQLLYNGRIWRSLYGNVRGHEFFLSSDWYYGDVTVNRKTFTRVALKYDLLNDQLLTMANPGTIIILNRESVEKFIIKSNPADFHFVNYDKENTNVLKGYCHLVKDGKTKLLVKYVKQIKLLAVENKYDEFYQKQSVYLLKEGQLHRVSSKKDLLGILEDRGDEIRKHVREKGIKYNIRNPGSLVPLLEFYDSLSDSN